MLKVYIIGRVRRISLWLPELSILHKFDKSLDYKLRRDHLKKNPVSDASMSRKTIGTYFGLYLISLRTAVLNTQRDMAVILFKVELYRNNLRCLLGKNNYYYVIINYNYLIMINV